MLTIVFLGGFLMQYENSGEFQYANGLDGGLEAPAAAATPVGA